MKNLELTIWILFSIAMILATFGDKIKKHFQTARENAEKYKTKKSNKLNN